ncbi:Translational repressor Pumilio/PUF3 and related RNA-binding proteins (Puf superfamily) [Phaffia rhodozyma]|uniref:Translational repressor Pumilio/PUF3 and related RNA-binding proteins (Puf superfamily) n=1 Tax=Phaffia rhodozyma TaxID=264483 RepID=A0A0F7SJS8_PHARH|nr:Translational repressor Pumilio/PUF3 and related RNA-binding proteins (Puf superfamily) [Phaffia rhodozyma]
MFAMHDSIYDPADDIISHHDVFHLDRRPSLPHAFSYNSGLLSRPEKDLMAPSKDMALELMSRKIQQMEAKLNNQTAMMLQLRDENVVLKERYDNNVRDDVSRSLSPPYSVHSAQSFGFESRRDCRTEPGTPVDTAVKCAIGVIGENDFSTRMYEPDPEVVAKILSQSCSYSLVLPSEYRALTWTLANRTQRSAQEGHALKFAVNFLISRVHQLRGQPMENVVHQAILSELMGLAQTANGNYLVQQLIECGGASTRMDVYEAVRDNLLKLSNDKYGTHVVCKIAEYSEIRAVLIPDLIKIGVAETFQTGARRLWKAIFKGSSRANEMAVFDTIITEMRGNWTECATSTENGTISVQQVFETWPAPTYMEPVFVEIMENISRIANGGWGHFLISKILANPSTNLRSIILMALLESPSPVAVGHHGISFLRTALLELGRPGVEAYVDNLCTVKKGGHAPQIVEIAGTVVGPGHISFLWTMLTDAEKNKIKDACRNHIVSIRGSQSGNNLLRQLGLMPSNVIPKLR